MVGLVGCWLVTLTMQYQFWNDFVDSMYSEHLLSKTELDQFKYSLYIYLIIVLMCVDVYVAVYVAVMLMYVDGV